MMSFCKRCGTRLKQAHQDSDVQDLLEVTEDMTLEETQSYFRNHLNLIGRGTEAEVYGLNAQTAVKKTHPVNARGEYVIFADPQYEDITPEVRGHHPDWYWIAVERVEPFEPGAWERVFEYLPSFERVYGDTPSYFMLAETFQNALLEANDQLTPEDIRSQWDRVDSDERRWMNKVVDIFNDLGMRIGDIRPSNLGVDQDGNLVVVDIRTADKTGRRTQAAQEVPPKVYHATPYPDSILSEGFKLRSEQTFGGHEAEYISATSRDNAQTYAEGLQLAVAFLGEHIDWYELKSRLTTDWDMSEKDWRLIFELRTDDIIPIHNVPDRDEVSLIDFVRKRAMNQQTVDGDRTDRQEETRRRWHFIKGIHRKSDEFPLFFGFEVPRHLLDIRPGDVGVVEARVRPGAEVREMSHGSGLGPDNGNVTYNGNEQEWRFWDPDLLEPIDVIRV
jgi:hypothetical protein